MECKRPDLTVRRWRPRSTAPDPLTQLDNPIRHGDELAWPAGLLAIASMDTICRCELMKLGEIRVEPSPRPDSSTDQTSPRCTSNAIRGSSPLATRTVPTGPRPAAER